MLDTVAAFVAMSKTWQQAVLRFSVFMLLVAISVEAGHWTGLPVSIGWMFGYIWGALTVYGSMHKGIS